MLKRLLSSALIFVLAMSSIAKEEFSFGVEISQEQKLQLERFQKLFYLAYPKSYPFKEAISAKLALPDEKPPVNEILQIIYDDFIKEEGAKFLTSLKTFYHSDEQKIVAYLSEQYFTDSDNRAANHFLIDLLQAGYQDIGRIREEVNRKQSFLPHFEKGAAEYTLVAAALWAGYKYKFKGSKTIFNKAVAKGAVQGAVKSAVTKAATNPKSYSKARYSFGNAIRKTLFNRNGQARSIPAFLALTGTTGVVYGGPSYLLYRMGYFDVDEPTHFLNQHIYALAATDLTCRVLEFEKDVNALQISSLANEVEQKKVDEFGVAVNDLVEDFSTIAGTVPSWNNMVVSSAIVNTNGKISSKELKIEPFDCPALQNHSGKIEVNIKWTREKLRAAIDVLMTKVQEAKYGSTVKPIDDFVKSNQGHSEGVIKSTDSLATRLLSVVNKNEFSLQHNLNNLFTFYRNLTIDSAWLGDVVSGYEEFAASESTEALDFVADNVMMSIADADTLNVFVFENLVPIITNKETRAAGIMLAIVLHNKFEELKANSPEDGERLISPLMSVYFFSLSEEQIKTALAPFAESSESAESTLDQNQLGETEADKPEAGEGE